jgi:RNA recognition motif-containing protein
LAVVAFSTTMTSKNDPASSHRVFVGGISWKVPKHASTVLQLFSFGSQADEQSLANFFSSFGKVTECKIIMDKVTGKSKGYEIVAMW